MQPRLHPKVKLQLKLKLKLKLKLPPHSYLKLLLALNPIPAGNPPPLTPHPRTPLVGHNGHLGGEFAVLV